tara:strand:+ start:228 stop:329 length:102 start_codon:yes stop_codon:yes gene_type:complete
MIIQAEAFFTDFDPSNQFSSATAITDMESQEAS